jgi:hypothetical protein
MSMLVVFVFLVSVYYGFLTASLHLLFHSTCQIEVEYVCMYTIVFNDDTSLVGIKCS